MTTIGSPVYCGNSNLPLWASSSDAIVGNSLTLVAPSSNVVNGVMTVTGGSNGTFARKITDPTGNITYAVDSMTYDPPSTVASYNLQVGNSAGIPTLKITTDTNNIVVSKPVEVKNPVNLNSTTYSFGEIIGPYGNSNVLFDNGGSNVVLMGNTYVEPAGVTIGPNFRSGTNTQIVSNAVLFNQQVVTTSNVTYNMVYGGSYGVSNIVASASYSNLIWGQAGSNNGLAKDVSFFTPTGSTSNYYAYVVPAQTIGSNYSGSFAFSNVAIPVNTPVTMTWSMATSPGFATVPTMSIQTTNDPNVVTYNVPSTFSNYSCDFTTGISAPYNVFFNVNQVGGGTGGLGTPVCVSNVVMTWGQTPVETNVGSITQTSSNTMTISATSNVVIPTLVCSNATISNGTISNSSGTFTNATVTSNLTVGTINTFPYPYPSTVYSSNVYASIVGSGVSGTVSWTMPSNVISNLQSNSTYLFNINYALSWAGGTFPSTTTTNRVTATMGNGSVPYQENFGVQSTSGSSFQVKDLNNITFIGSTGSTPTVTVQVLQQFWVATPSNITATNWTVQYYRIF
jgi:hypothetical protein